MPFTVIAWNEARAAIQTIDPLAATDDEHAPSIGDDIFVPKFTQLIGVYGGHGVTAVAGTPSQGYLDSPSLRRFTRHELARLVSFNVTNPVNSVQLVPLSPIPLDEGEALNAFLANTAVCAAGRGLIAAFLADAPIAPISGDIRTILCTSVVVGTLGIWTNGPLTLAYDLPAGRYQVVGARCLAGATSQIFRLIFPEQWHRPGGVSQRVLLDDDICDFRRGNLGVWGEFTHRVLPRLEVLNIETVANPSIYLDIIKLA